jgi:hypothetical protein
VVVQFVGWINIVQNGHEVYILLKFLVVDLTLVHYLQVLLRVDRLFLVIAPLKS